MVRCGIRQAWRSSSGDLSGLAERRIKLGNVTQQQCQSIISPLSHVARRPGVCLAALFDGPDPRRRHLIRQRKPNRPATGAQINGDGLGHRDLLQRINGELCAGLCLRPGHKDPRAHRAFNGAARSAPAAALRGTQIPNQIFPDRLFDEQFGDLLVSNSPTGPFPAPVLVAQGLADELVLPTLQERWVQERCEAGIEIDFRTFPGLGHVSLVAEGSPLNPQLVSWTLDRWADKPATPNCAAQADSAGAEASASASG